MHTYTLNNVGDTIKEIHHYINTEKVVVVDSTERYKAKVDSLQRLVDKKAEKVTVKEKPAIPMWEKLVFVGIVFLVCIAVLKSRSS